MNHSDSKPNRDLADFLDAAVRNIDPRQAEQALRERERLLDSLLGFLPGSAYRALADEHWTALFVSKGIEDLTGYPPDVFTSGRLNYNDLMLPEDWPATREAVVTALRERRVYDVGYRIRHKDGSVRWIWARGHGVFAPDGSLRIIEGWNLDITPGEQTEEESRHVNARLDLAERGSNLAIWECDMPDGTIENSHPTLINVWESLGYDPLTAPTAFAPAVALAVHPDDQERVRREIQEFLASDSREFESEYRVRHKDGSDRRRPSRGVVLRDPGGKPVRFNGRPVGSRQPGPAVRAGAAGRPHARYGRPGTGRPDPRAGRVVCHPHHPAELGGTAPATGTGFASCGSRPTCSSRSSRTNSSTRSTR